MKINSVCCSDIFFTTESIEEKQIIIPKGWQDYRKWKKQNKNPEGVIDISTG